MATPTRWRPFGPVARFAAASGFEDRFDGLSPGPLLREFGNPVPALRIDMRQDESSCRVKVDLRGARKEHIQVSIEGNQVRVEAEVKREGHRRQVHADRYAGKSCRASGLAQEVDVDKSGAQYDDAVLTLPEKGNGQARRLAIV